jgi:hypothetical protein
MDPQLVSAPRHNRRSLRRAVQLEAHVMSDLWDGAVALTLTNLSQHGAWLDSELSLDVGDELSLTFTPPHWQTLGLPRLHARATVARVSLRRRRCDSASAGMGLRFTGLSRATARRLDAALRGVPPPLPISQRQHVVANPSDHDLAVIRMDDGTSYVLLAEAPLLSLGRPSAAWLQTHAQPRQASIGSAPGVSIAGFLLEAATTACANDASSPAFARTGSPMTAIFQRARSAAS